MGEYTLILPIEWPILRSFVSILGDKISVLRAQGMSYKAIAKELNCAVSSVSFHVGRGQKLKASERVKKRRRTASAMIKELHGGECTVCGYDKCISALEFDHLVPGEKSYTISSRRGNVAFAMSEADKCILLCCRCHRERHYGLLDIGPYLEPPE